MVYTEENKIEIIQKWEGKVTRIRDDNFSAYSLKTNESYIFDFELVSEDFLVKVKVGTKVTYIRQYETTPGGQKKKVSFLELKEE